MPNPIFCALDRPDLPAALALAGRLRGAVGGFKLGLELFAAEGPRAVEALGEIGLPLFLDLKLHDIPNTVARSVAALDRLPVAMLTVHAAGGAHMVAAAADAAGGRLVLAVTVLTSLDADDLAATGIGGDATNQALRLADLALKAGAGGIVCSAHEVRAMRERFGPGPKLVVPGIRPAAADDDQKRTTTPAEALEAGADILVVGRPITGAPDPAGAACGLLAQARGT